VSVPVLTVDDVNALKAASALNWSAIDPSIFGTLFERGLDPSVRSQLGVWAAEVCRVQVFDR
jgi:hypothetical protein